MTVATSPLVSAYLADLDRALAGADPGDRAEIVDAVREHIDAALAELGAAPSQAEIAGVLRRLGSADAVAAAWAAGTDRSVAPGMPYGAPPARANRWPAWAVTLLVVAGFLGIGPLLLAPLAALFLVPVQRTVGGTTTPGWVAALVVGALVLGSVACLVAGIRSHRHRVAWLVAFAVGLAITVVVALAFGTAAFHRGETGGGHVEEGTGVVVERGVVAPTPSPAAGS